MKPETKKHILRDSIYTKVSKRHICSQKDQWLPRAEIREGIDWAEATFWGDGNLLEMDSGEGCIII